MDADDEPDWVIDLASPPVRPTVEQAALLAELERTLARFGSRPADPHVIAGVVAPLVHGLHESGMTANSIAAHSRIRPEGIARILA